jgi:hypothetical protein
MEENAIEAAKSLEKEPGKLSETRSQRSYFGSLY